MINEKIDRRKKYYLILDCETATLPYAAKYEEEQKKNIAIAKPLIYDLGWQVIDRNGKIYKRKSFVISEIFSVPQVFNTAYYAHKRPIYLERLKKGETILTDWNTAIAELLEDMQYVESVGAYNSMFDFKKAIPFTELYIKMLYSPEFYEWEKMQNELCERIANGYVKPNTKEFERTVFRFRGKAYDLFDVWGLSCEHIMNNADYNRQLKAIQVMSGINTRLHSHLARHTFATYMLRNGVKIEHVSRMLGHTNITQTQRYAKVLAQDIHDEFDRIEKKLNKKAK